mmetsp:Transcript_75219/g.133203  ORF Transcript_75219/g.133203 Transcript_75219/m.133203 type:complete len:80 (-) Transcript_75219:486-725(-)
MSLRLMNKMTQCVLQTRGDMRGVDMALKHVKPVLGKIVKLLHDPYVILGILVEGVHLYAVIVWQAILIVESETVELTST